MTLNAKFTGTGHDTHYYFEYGPTKEYGQVSGEAPGSDAGTTTGATNISSEISNYYGYSTYHYRVVASNEFGESVGKDMTFTTEPAPLPEISGTSVTDLTPTGATLSAMVAPNRWDASWLFEWGETTSYEGLTELEDVLTGDDFTVFQPVTATIGGLKPATLYHYRAVAFNFTGAINGPDLTFMTPDQPKVESSEVSAVGQTSAHLSGRVIANSSPTDVHFEFGTSTAYGGSTAATSIGSERLARVSAVDLTGLTPGTTYHFRMVGVNEFGTTPGPDQTFTTQPAPQAPPAPEQRKCRKGKVKRNGKCVKKKKKKQSKRQHRNGKRNG